MNAWYGFSEAMRHDPFSVHFLYFSSVNYTLAYLPEPGPLCRGPAGRHRALADYREGINHADLEYNNAALIDCIWASACNYYEIYRLKCDWSEAMLPQYQAICARERQIVARALPLAAADPRQGFHIEAHRYLFGVEQLQEKLKLLGR